MAYWQGKRSIYPCDGIEGRAPKGQEKTILAGKFLYVPRPYKVTFASKKNPTMSLRETRSAPGLPPAPGQGEGRRKTFPTASSTLAKLQALTETACVKERKKKKSLSQC